MRGRPKRCWWIAPGVAVALSACRGDSSGVAKSVRAWAGTDGVMSLSTACRIPAGAITADDHSVAMPADVSVLSVSLRDVGGSGERSFTARLRLTLRDSVAPAPVRRRLFDTDVSGFAARVSPPSSTTPRLIPLPTYDGWTLRAVRVAGCARRADDIAAFFSGIFAET